MVYNGLFIYIYIYIYLVGGIPNPLKNMTSSVGMIIFPNIWKVMEFHGSKPPTRDLIEALLSIHVRYSPKVSKIFQAP